jgi:hypothetical protein
VLNSIAQGKTQLPDFQRGWVWDDDHIKSLLASVSLSYPIGAVMMLQTGGAAQFKPRPVEGVAASNPADPERLILDGRQRLTSLFQSLRSGRPVETRTTRNKPIKRWYYLDIKKALDPNIDREDAVVSLPEDRRLLNFRGELLADCSTLQNECAAELLPFDAILDFQRLNTWMLAFVQGIADVHARLARWNELNNNILSHFQQYQVPLILLRKQTPKEAVCQVFEKVNTGGVPLTVFELVTATFAAEGYQLRHDSESRKQRLEHATVLKGLENTEFLQAVTLLATHARRREALASGVSAASAPGISCKRRDILRLTRSEYEKWAPVAEDGYKRVAQLLFSQKIFSARDLPYHTQLTPLAAILGELGDGAAKAGVRDKLLRWYWCGVFGELYGGAVETRFARDLPEVLAWIAGGTEPITVTEATFARARFLTLRTRNSAAYKGFSALLMRDGGYDFITGQPIDVARYFDERVEIHHIFPQHWCQTHGIEPRRCDSIVNKTPLAAATNRTIGGHAPSRYLPVVQRRGQLDKDQMDEVLRTHVIEPRHLHADDLAAFFESRATALMERVQAATGRTTEQLAGAADVDAEPDEGYDEEERSDDAGVIEEAAPPAAMAALLDDFERVRASASAPRDVETFLDEFERPRSLGG